MPESIGTFTSNGVFDSKTVEILILLLNKLRIIVAGGKMKKFILKGITLAISILLLISTALHSQKNITENIQVEEWIVPIYAVNTHGGIAPEITRSDIELFVNGIRVSDFNFIKRSLLSKNSLNKKPVDLQKEDEKTIVLVFDTALSKATAIMKSKLIAKKIVKSSNKDTQFLIFRIEPFWGMNYLAGPIKNKKKIREIIKDRINVKGNRRSTGSGLDQSNGKYSKYTGREQSFFLVQQTRYLSYKSSQFALSFRSLYYAVSNLLGSKFIYLFSEGISNASWVRGDVHGGTMAKYLLKSGAVLFFINPAGGTGNDLESGEGFLRGLAEMSGGKYIYGDTKMINREINNVHKSYYEITFHTPDNFNSKIINIVVKSKIKGIKIHTIRNLERSKKYLELSDTEKKLLVLNIVSKNPFFKIPLSIEDVKLKNKKTDNGETSYQIYIPKHFLKRPIDIYKIHTTKMNKRPKIEVSTDKITEENYTIKMKNIPNYINNFVLVNYELGFALVKGVDVKKVKISNISYGNNNMTFKLSGFKLKKVGGKRVALLKITVKVISEKGVVLKSDTKEISLIKKNSVVKIPITKVIPENFYIIVIAKDLIAKQETNSTQYIKK